MAVPDWFGMMMSLEFSQAWQPWAMSWAMRHARPFLFQHGSLKDVMGRCFAVIRGSSASPSKLLCRSIVASWSVSGLEPQSLSVCLKSPLIVDEV